MIFNLKILPNFLILPKKPCSCETLFRKFLLPKITLILQLSQIEVFIYIFISKVAKLTQFWTFQQALFKISSANLTIGKGGDAVSSNNHVSGNKGENTIIDIMDSYGNTVNYIAEGGGKGGGWSSSNNNTTGNDNDNYQ